MGTKTVRLDEDVYEYIRAKKREGETFSDTIERLTSEWTLLDFASDRSEEAIERHEELIEATEEAGKEASREVLEEMGSGVE
jgi:predicted CopG family antitoxin